ncbi:hypothetical protein B566_EDAN012769 [Ephemera danica]|nr:hypothetical protein B566_EDAN012769 [Ephemera danica]
MEVLVDVVEAGKRGSVNIFNGVIWYKKVFFPPHKYEFYQQKFKLTQCFLSTSSSASHFLVRKGYFLLIISPSKNVVKVGNSSVRPLIFRTGLVHTTDTSFIERDGVKPNYDRSTLHRGCPITSMNDLNFIAVALGLLVALELGPIIQQGPSNAWLP